MPQTLYSKQTPQTVYTEPKDTPKFQFLIYDRFLSEFKTELDKARVRENLGIPDEYSYNWGHISGAIENQADLMRILNNITKKQSSVETQLIGLNATVNELIGDTTSSITVQQLYSQFLDLKINVAQNSTDITSLIAGGDSSLSIQVNTNKSNIEALTEKVNNITLGNDITTRLTALDNKVSSYDTQIASLQSQISALQSQIGSNELSSITLNQTTLTVANGTGDQTIIVTAHYTKASDTDVTDQVTVNSSNTNVATWVDNKVKIVGAGSAILTFTFGTKTAELSITVESAITTNDIFYIGYTSSVTELLTGTTYQKTNLNGNWDSANIPKQFKTITGTINFYIAIPIKYTTLTVTAAGLPVGMNKMSTTYTSLGVSYNVYKLSQITNYNTVFTITLS